jgi:large subunit ribosomal protein L10
MVSPDKEAAVAQLAGEFRESNGAVLTEYRGLTVKQLQELRRSLGEHARYAVAKNTLTKLAAKQADVELPDELLVGPTAIAFITGDVVEAAKGLRDFAKENKTLVIKGGFLDGKVLQPNEIKKLADLESREVLLAKLAGGMKASIAGAAGLFNAPLAQTARLLAALQAVRISEGAEADPSVLAAAPVDEVDKSSTVVAEASAPVDEVNDVGAEAAEEEAPADEPAAETEAPVDEAPTAASDDAPASDEAGSEG